MAGSTHCFVPLLGKRIRVTELNEAGKWPTGPEATPSLATNGFVSVKLSAEVEDGSEIITKKADGSLCVNEKFADSFKRFTVEIEFCGVNPALLAMVSNAETYADATGDIAGITVAEGDIQKFFALELWTGLSGVSSSENGDVASGYILLPFVVAGVLGDIEVGGEDAITFSITGASTKGGNGWGTGPYKVVKDTGGTPGVLPTALDPLDHFLMMDTALALPPSACDPVAIPALA